MSKRQLAALFLCNMVLYATGSGVVGLLPVYASRLGADPALNGFLLAFAFFSLAASNVVAGRLSERLQRRKHLLIVGGALAAPLTWLMSGATSVGQLALLIAVSWFASGTALVMVNIIAGLFAEENERGRVFGIVGLGGPAGVLLGGLSSGPIVDRWGFPALFTLAALFYLLIPLIGLLLKDKPVVPRQATGVASRPQRIFSNQTFLFLFCASVIAHIASSEIVFIRPLMMDGFKFDATAISSSGAVGGLIGLPLPVLVGWLSDRLGRKPFIVLCYLATTVGLLILAAASDLWHFWAASALQSVMGSSIVVGSALITDLFPRDSLSTPLSVFGATPWIGFVIGFGGGGAAVNLFQITPTLVFGALLSVIAVFLLLPVRARTELAYSTQGAAD